MLDTDIGAPGGYARLPSAGQLSFDATCARKLFADSWARSSVDSRSESALSATGRCPSARCAWTRRGVRGRTAAGWKFKQPRPRLCSKSSDCLDRKISNFVEFIGEGRGSQALASALDRAEAGGDRTAGRDRGLSSSGLSAFATPPDAWVAERLTTLQSVLERRTGPAGLILRRILGPVVLEPVQPGVGRPTIAPGPASTLLALLEPDPGEISEPGSSVLRRWSQRESNPCSRRERPVS